MLAIRTTPSPATTRLPISAVTRRARGVVRPPRKPPSPITSSCQATDEAPTPATNSPAAAGFWSSRDSPTVIAAAITSQTGKARLPTHIELSARNYGLSRDSVILLEQIRTLDKSRLRERMGQLDGPTMDRVNSAIAVSFGLAQ